jgi:hypothetical protein
MRRFVNIDGDFPQRAILIPPHGAHVFDHETRLGDLMQDTREPVGCVGRFDLEDFRNFHLRGSASTCLQRCTRSRRPPCAAVFQSQGVFLVAAAS